MNEETTPHIIHTHDSSYSKSEREPIQHQLDQSEVEELDEGALMAQLGLGEHLSTQRANGLRSMVLRIKAHAAAARAAA